MSCSEDVVNPSVLEGTRGSPSCIYKAHRWYSSLNGRLPSTVVSRSTTCSAFIAWYVPRPVPSCTALHTYPSQACKRPRSVRNGGTRDRAEYHLFSFRNQRQLCKLRQRVLQYCRNSHGGTYRRQKGRGHRAHFSHSPIT